MATRKTGKGRKLLENPTSDTQRYLQLLFVAVLLLWDWPLLTISFSRGIEQAFWYLMAVWAGLILVLFLAARRTAAQLDGKKPKD